MDISDTWNQENEASKSVGRLIGETVNQINKSTD